MRSKFNWQSLLKRFDNGGAAENNQEGGKDNNGDSGNTVLNDENSENDRTFTQAQVNKMMKAEKEKGRRSVLSELGVEDVKNAKEALEEYKKYTESQKTELQKATDDLQAANKKAAEAEERAQKAEYCLKAISLGAASESVEDLVAMATTKVNDEKDIDAVLKEMKENKAYSGFFDSADKKEDKRSQGTGNPFPNNKGTGGNSGENYGAMLAKKSLQSLNKFTENTGGN